MITPALLRWITGVLTHEDTGINVRSAQVPRGVDEAAPPAVVVWNSADDDLVAGSVPPEATADAWVLHVQYGLIIEASADASDKDQRDGAQIVLQLNGITVEGDSAVTLANAYRIMRAARRCIRDAFRALGMDALILEEQQIVLGDSLRLLIKEPSPGAGEVDLALVVPLEITDSWV